MEISFEAKVALFSLGPACAVIHLARFACKWALKFLHSEHGGGSFAYLLGCCILAPLAAATPICFALALLRLPTEARGTKHSAELQTALIMSSPVMCLLCFVLSNKTKRCNRVWKVFKASTVLTGLLLATLIMEWFGSTLRGVLFVACLSAAIIAAACLLQYVAQQMSQDTSVLIFTCIALTALFPIPLHAIADPSFILLYFTMTLPSFVAAGVPCTGSPHG